MSSEIPHQQLLLDPDSRARLPELFGGYEQGLDALAQVKFITPDSNRVWYASEACILLKDDHYIPLDDAALNSANVVDVVFFGLLSGEEVKLGSFCLSELQNVHGPEGLPIKRDVDFQPRSLRELKALHEQGLTG